MTTGSFPRFLLSYMLGVLRLRGFFLIDENEKRICLGLEISPKYVAVILERATKAGMEPQLVIEETAPF